MSEQFPLPPDEPEKAAPALPEGGEEVSEPTVPYTGGFPCSEGYTLS